MVGHSLGGTRETSSGLANWISAGAQALLPRRVSNWRRGTTRRAMSLPAAAALCSVFFLATSSSSPSPLPAGAMRFRQGGLALPGSALPGRAASTVCKLRAADGAALSLRLKGGVADDDDFSGPDEPPHKTGLTTEEQMAQMLEEGGSDWSSMDKDKVFEGLRSLYLKRVKPLEEASWYSHFATGATLEASDFDAKPMVLLLGQYSVGKTSFIRSLLGQNFPGMRIGPEPTTDGFTAVMHGVDERSIPGHALSMQKDSPFHGLSDFGNSFLSRFNGATSAAPILRNITLIDTPGVLAGKKQSTREYNYGEVVEWFASRADLIIVMFDAHKLDISDELTAVLEKLRGHQEKIRILLNKVQQIDTQQLMRVYGALMWSLGKVMHVPEVPRVFMGSFWDQDETNTDKEWLGSQAHAALLDREKQDLLRELITLPQNSIMRRVSELVKRARAVKVHAYLIHYLRKQIAGWATVTVWDKGAKQAELIESLDKEFVMAARRYNLPLGDFPNLAKMKASLREIKDLRAIPRLNKNMITDMERMFTAEIPKLLDDAARATARGPPKRGPRSLD